MSSFTSNRKSLPPGSGHTSYIPWQNNERPRSRTHASHSTHTQGLTQEPLETSAHELQWPVYALHWSRWPQIPDGAPCIAVGSFLEESSNRLQILAQRAQSAFSRGTNEQEYFPDVSSAQFNSDFEPIAEAEVTYPLTKVQWEPFQSNRNSPNLIATSSDILRIWGLTDETIQPYTRSCGLKVQAECINVIFIYLFIYFFFLVSLEIFILTQL